MHHLGTFYPFYPCITYMNSEVNDESVASILALSQLVSLAIFNTGLTERGQVNCTITYLLKTFSSPVFSKLTRKTGSDEAG